MSVTGSIPLGEAIFWGLVTFSLLVLLHEGGHFLAARAFGVRVHEFMIGLPGPSLRFKRNGTAFGVTAIPLGGYVRIAGMEPGPEDDLLAAALGIVVDAGRAHSVTLTSAMPISSDRALSLLITLADWGAVVPADDDTVSYVAQVARGEGESDQDMLDRVRSTTYRGKSPLKRVTILAMGVLVNLVAAILTFTIVLSVWGYYVASLNVAEVRPGSGAEAAGVRAGDRIVALDGAELGGWEDLLRVIGGAKPGQTIAVTYERDGERLTGRAVLGEFEGRPLLGITADSEHVRSSVPQALGQSLGLTWEVAKVIGRFLTPSTFKETLRDVQGVVGISVMAAEAAKAGPLDYAGLVALLSLSLGLMNLLPIPPLDGGKILIEIVEKLAGRPLKREFSLGLSAAGAVLLFSLIGYLMYADVVRYVGNG